MRDREWKRDRESERERLSEIGSGMVLMYLYIQEIFRGEREKVESQKERE